MSASLLCFVCDLPLVEPDLATCYACGRDFHLATTIGSTTADCGVILMDPVSIGLLFACRVCGPGEGLEPVP